MRILVISEVTGYMRGGVPASMVRLIQGLTERGHAVALAGDVVPKGAEAARHYTLTLPIGRRLADEVGAAIAAFAPDVVHLMAISSRGLVQLRALLARRRWLLTCHSLPPYERKLPALHGSDALHYGVRSLRFLANTVAWKWLLRQRFIPDIVVHSAVMEDTVARYGFARPRIALIPLGYEAAPASHTSGVRAVGQAPRIATMGGIAHTKGQHDALAAVAQLRRDFPGLRYRILGEVRDKTYLQFLNERVARLGLADCVSITPSVSHAEKEQALREADLYVQPSHEEGFCLAYIEAAGLVPRLVGADSGAIRLIGADDAGARTVPIRQPAALARAMRELLDTRLPDDLMARRAARLTARFSWEQYLDGHEALYRRVLDAEALPQPAEEAA
jgi:glycosyltransferase involved in cell wall biosynthesis